MQLVEQRQGRPRRRRQPLPRGRRGARDLRGAGDARAPDDAHRGLRGPRARPLRARRRRVCVRCASCSRRELPARVRPPGVVAAYSNHGAALAMLVVEQVSGMPWKEYVETQILAPLGMKRTTFRQPVPEALRDDVSIGYRKPDGEPDAADFEYVPLAPAGALSSTATDMARFMLAHLDSGRLGDARILSEADGAPHAPHAPPARSRGAGDGARLHRERSQRPPRHRSRWRHALVPHRARALPRAGRSGSSLRSTPPAPSRRSSPRRSPTATSRRRSGRRSCAPADWIERARRFVGAYRSVRYSHHDLTKLGALIVGGRR